MARRTLPCRSRDRQPAARRPTVSGPERTSPRQPRDARRGQRPARLGSPDDPPLALTRTVTYAIGSSSSIRLPNGSST